MVSELFVVGRCDSFYGRLKKLHVRTGERRDDRAARGRHRGRSRVAIGMNEVATPLDQAIVSRRANDRMTRTSRSKPVNDRQSA
jgi:hypothetical protein